MSFMFDVDIKGEQDFGAITPQEIFQVFLDYDIERINSMACLWRMTNKKTGETIETTHPFDEKDFPRSKWDAEQLNKWAFDIN
jgi:hypothetical protein